MSKPTHAPGWRGRPARVGQIVGIQDSPSKLEAALIATTGAIAAVVLIGAALMLIVDAIAGHVKL